MSAMLVAGAKRLGRMAKTSFAIVGFAGTAGTASYVYAQRKFQEEDAKEKNQVLVLPFHRIKLIDKTKRKSFSQLAEAANSTNPMEEMDVAELVELIHEASADPNIVGLYGEFGHGRGFTGGAADAEEIRNALRVFRESHRVHSEPNTDHLESPPQKGDKEPKQMHAYADTFSSLGQSSNPDYYIASMFREISIQKQGCLNLFGYCGTIPFFRQTLEKYGAKVHCYKHGDYKNAPNQFTHSYLTKQHRQNVENYLFALNEYQCQDISIARPKANLTLDLWKLIQNSGSFSPAAAHRMGLMDHAVDKSPLDTLVHHEEVEKITLGQYRKKVAQRKKIRDDNAGIAEQLQTFTQKAPDYVQSYVSNQGWYQKYATAPGASKETIALLKLQGGIDSKQWNKVSPALEKIRKDDSIKAVVVRVDSPGGSIEASETILQELKALNKKIVVSFGNVAASGGYYVASHADQIFASQNTITGSIGVFGLRFDLSGAAKQYGVNFAHVTTSDYATSNSVSALFSPPTKAHHANAIKSVGLAYDRFREVVSTGRDMKDDQVLKLAEGRVFTGLQASQNGLIDSIGGLHKAIAFAKRTYTSGDAKVVDMSEDNSLKAQLMKLLSGEQGFLAQTLLQVLAKIADEDRSSRDAASNPLINFGISLPAVLPRKAYGIYLTIDEDEAIRSMLQSGSEDI